MRKNAQRILAIILVAILVFSSLGQYGQGNHATASAAAMEENFEFAQGFFDGGVWVNYHTPDFSVEVGLTAVFGDAIWPFQNGVDNCSYLVNGQPADAPFPVDTDGTIQTVCDGINGPDWGFLFVWHADAGEFETPISGVTAEALSPIVEIGETVVLSATVSSGSFMTTTWQVADETVGVGNPISYTTSMTGTQVVTVTATNFVNSKVATTTLEVLPPPPPFFELSATTNMVEIGMPIFLSTTTNMDLIAVVIDPRDGSEIAFGESVTHTYGVGTYNPIAYGIPMGNTAAAQRLTADLTMLETMAASGDVVTATTTVTVTPHIYTINLPMIMSEWTWTPPQPITTTWSFSGNATWAQWYGQTERGDTLEVGLTIVDGAFWPFINTSAITETISFTMDFEGQEVPDGFVPAGAGTFQIWPDWEPLGYTPTEPENGLIFEWNGYGWEMSATL